MKKVEFKVNLAPVSNQAALELNGTFINGVDSTAVKENGSIVISTASNTNLYNLIWNNLQGMLKVEIKED